VTTSHGGPIHRKWHESGEKEAATVAALYRNHSVSTDTLLGDNIDEDSLRQRCGSPDKAPTVLHLAVHGANVESDTPMESWLLLPKSRLDGIDLVPWQIDGATVVLSACSAGQRAVGGRRMEELPGDDLFGLQAALFAAGARQVLGALWTIDGNVATEITGSFHEQLLAGAAADVALQRAVVMFLDEHKLGRFRRSTYWAPFFLSCLGTPTHFEAGSRR
jgi:CHAT domain-containing protein